MTLESGQELTLGGYIRAKRTEAGFQSVNKFSRAKKIPQGLLSHLENDRPSHPLPQTLDHIAELMGNVDRDVMYMLAGYWPPSFRKDPSMLEYLRQNRSDFIVTDQPTLLSLPELVSPTMLRELRGDLSQRVFGRKCGISQSYISALETGTAPLTRETFLRLSDRFSIKL